MKRINGYYWVQLNMDPARSWICALYREVPSGGYWFLPGLNGPLQDDHFHFISPAPIISPNTPNTTIWTPT